MPMTQADIHSHYETEWKQKSERARGESDLSYSQDFDDEAIYPRLVQLIADLGIRVDGGRVLDVGSGSGRWLRYFLDRYKPRRLVGIDYTVASIDLLRKWSPQNSDTELKFSVADITDPALDLGEQFDLVNISSVLFHIPEQQLFDRALSNLAKLVAEDGYIITNEYLPHMTLRTEWMLVRSRYEFENAVHVAGLRIVDIRPCIFFEKAAMGIDGPDDGVRGKLQAVRVKMDGVMKSNLDESSRSFFEKFFAEIDEAMLAFCSQYIAPINLPGAKLVVLKRTN